MQLALLLASSDGGGGGSLFGLLIPFAIIGAIMYMLLIRPQRKKLREQSALQSAIGVGDEVITNTGIYGFITGEDAEQGLFWLEIDDDVQIRIAKGAIARRIDSDDDGEDVDDDDDDDEDVDAAADADES
jgi:preprotein translocase subunit YajC